jgi:hypothetical protein
MPTPLRPRRNVPKAVHPLHRHRLKGGAGDIAAAFCGRSKKVAIEWLSPNQFKRGKGQDNSNFLKQMKKLSADEMYIDECCRNVDSTGRQWPKYTEKTWITRLDRAAQGRNGGLSLETQQKNTTRSYSSTTRNQAKQLSHNDETPLASVHHKYVCWVFHNETGPEGEARWCYYTYPNPEGGPLKYGIPQKMVEEHHAETGTYYESPYHGAWEVSPDQLNIM